MDFERIQKLKAYTKQIKLFKKLKKYKNINNEIFYRDMKQLFPKFENESPVLFKSIIENEDLGILKLMFDKLEIIENEYNRRLSECDKIKDTIQYLKSYLVDKDKVSVNELREVIKSRDNKFSDKYSVIIDKLVDPDYRNYSVEQLLLEQIKFGYEVQIGQVLANKYLPSDIKEK